MVNNSIKNSSYLALLLSVSLITACSNINREVINSRKSSSLDSRSIYKTSGNVSPESIPKTINDIDLMNKRMLEKPNKNSADIPPEGSTITPVNPEEVFGMNGSSKNTGTLIWKEKIDYSSDVGESSIDEVIDSSNSRFKAKKPEKTKKIKTTSRNAREYLKSNHGFDHSLDNFDDNLPVYVVEQTGDFTKAIPINGQSEQHYTKMISLIRAADGQILQTILKP